MRKSSRHDDGMAMILTVIVIMVLTMLCLSLLLYAYSYFYSSMEETDRFKAKEAAYTLAQTVCSQICDTEFETFEAQGSASKGDERQLWFYIRDKLGTDDWNEGEKRYFSLKELETTECDDITLTLYYESDDAGQVTLYIQTEAEISGVLAKTTRSCVLEVLDYPDSTGDEQTRKWKWEEKT